MATESLRSLQKRPYVNVDDDQLNTALDIEKKILKKFISVIDNKAVICKILVPSYVMELENNYMGILMFRFETDIDSPRFIYMSQFLFATKCENVPISIRQILTNIYSENNLFEFIDKKSIFRSFNVIGLTVNVLSGYNCLVSCTMNGNSYNLLKTTIHGMQILKDLFIDLKEKKTGRKYIYQIFLNVNKMYPHMYVISSDSCDLQHVINQIRYRLSNLRYEFLCDLEQNSFDIFGCIIKLGYCQIENIKNCVLEYKGYTLPIIKIDDFYMETGQKEFFI